MSILAALTMIIAPPEPLKARATATATATARAVIIEAARIDFARDAVRVRKDRLRVIDFE